MSFYDDMSAVAIELLAEFGMPIVLTRGTGETFDPVSDEVTPGASREYSPNGIFTEWDDSLLKAFGNVESGDGVILIDGTVKPLTTDSVTADGVDYGIVAIQPIKPATKALAYYLQVRK